MGTGGVKLTNFVAEPIFQKAHVVHGQYNVMHVDRGCNKCSPMVAHKVDLVRLTRGGLG